MGTDAFFRVLDDRHRPLVGIYQHWNGYLERGGVRLAKVLYRRKLLRERTTDRIIPTSFTMGCLAATLIAALKAEEESVRIWAPNSDTRGICYVYEISQTHVIVNPDGDEDASLCQTWDGFAHYLAKQPDHPNGYGEFAAFAEWVKERDAELKKPGGNVPPGGQPSR